MTPSPNALVNKLPNAPSFPAHSSGRLGMPVLKYPGHRYHATKESVIVNSDEDVKALGAGWQETPFPVVPGKTAAQVAEESHAAALADLQAKHDELVRQLEAATAPSVSDKKK